MRRVGHGQQQLLQHVWQQQWARLSQIQSRTFLGFLLLLILLQLQVLLLHVLLLLLQVLLLLLQMLLLLLRQMGS